METAVERLALRRAKVWEDMNMQRRNSRPAGYLRLLAIAVVSGALLLAPLKSSRATNWKEFGAGQPASADGMSFVLCLDTDSIRSNGNSATFRQRAHGRNATCASGTAIKTVTVDCAHQGATRYLATNPELRSIFGPVSALNDYVCEHRGASSAAAQDDDCGRYIAALDRCIGLAPTDEIRKSLRDLRDAAADLVRQGGDLAKLTCKADLPNMQTCMGHATFAPASAPAAEPRLAKPAPEHGDRLRRQARLPEQRESPRSASNSVQERSGSGIPTIRPDSGLPREQALSAAPRIAFASLAIKGSISLRGARFDDLALLKPEQFILEPGGTPSAFYVEIGMMDGAGALVTDQDTMWRAASAEPLGPVHPVTLTFDNGKGLRILRTIAIDDKYMITLSDQVQNYSSDAVVLRPYGLIGRTGVPAEEQHTDAFLVALPARGVQSILYGTMAGSRAATFDDTTSWIGLTTKKDLVVQLWPEGSIHARTSFRLTGRSSFQADYLLDPITVKPGETAAIASHVYAGTQDAAVAYHKMLGQ